MRLWFSCGLLLASQIEPLCAQISSDQTLPTPSQVMRNEQQILIDGGTQKGSNLFHSFEQFSVRSGEVLLFNNGSSISNIFSRVTGRIPSEIDGIISANGTANLFLLNPNGIVFGPNATIAVGGSFFATTADAILFSDGSRFSSTSPIENVLTVNVPIGLDFSASSGSIQVNDAGHQLYVTDPIFSPATRDSLTPTGLFVQPGRTLGLFGNGLTFDGGQVWAISGRVELGSIAQGRVYWDGQGNFNYQDVLSFGDVSLINRSLIDSSGVQGGMLRLHGKNISLSGGSVVLVQNLSREKSGNIEIHADTLNVLGMDAIASFRSSISNETFSGVGGDIDITARRINVLDGGSISTKAYQFARGGNINLDISESITIDNYSQLSPTFFSFIATGSFSEGNGGNLTAKAERIDLYNAGLMGTIALGKGNGGNLTLWAKDVTVDGASTKLPNFSALIASTASFGNAGDIILNLETLNLKNGGTVSTSTIAEGNAGNITINSSRLIRIEGFDPVFFKSSVIVAGAFNETEETRDLTRLNSLVSGKAGGILINANNIELDKRGFIQVYSENILNGGEIKINANILSLNNNSGLVAEGFNQGGEITIKNNILLLSNKSGITATGVNQGGEITITSNEIFLTNSSFIASSSEFIELLPFRGVLKPTPSFEATISQGGGNITINSNLIQTNNSTIIVLSTNSGDGGNLFIKAEKLLLSDTTVEATAIQGNGGNININSPIFFQSLDSSITASSQLGIDGTVNIDTTPYNFDVSTVKIPTQVSPSQVALKSCYDYNQRLTQSGQGQTQRDSNRAGRTFDDLIPMGQVVSSQVLPDGRVQLLTCQDILKSKLPQN